MSLKVFWQPAGIDLDQLGTSRPVEDETGNPEISDGDTPKIETSIRMLSMDTPEKSVTARGLSKAKILSLAPQLANWFESGDSPVPSPLAAFLKPLLAKPDAIEAHWSEGAAATDALKANMAARLAKPTGGRRRLFLRAADERFDRY